MQSDNCQSDRIEVSDSGNVELADAKRYCGRDSFETNSITNQLVMGKWYKENI